MTPEQRQLFERAVVAHRRGDLEKAAIDYAALLDEVPDHVDALQMFAMLRHRQGDPRRALALLDTALTAAPENAAIRANRSSVHLALNDFAAAETDAREATRRDPTSFGGWLNLGLALLGAEKPARAASAFARASALRPLDARAFLEWLSAAARSQQTFGIDERMRQPLPALAKWRNLAIQTAIQLENHGNATAAFVLLTQLRRESSADAEIVALQQLQTSYAKAALLEQQGKTDAALGAAEALLLNHPNHRGTRMLRASLLAERGDADAALAEYHRITALFPDDAVAASAMLIAMQHDPSVSAGEIADGHRAWAARFAASIDAPEIARADDTERALRIGWISPRFFSGLVADFFVDVLRRFDRSTMHHVLYDSGGVEDAITAEFRAAADEWHRVDTLGDEALCARIRADKIDVLVELSGHSPGNRLRALAARPARAQVSWLDYFHSTGVPAIDVLLSDAVLSPPDLSKNYTERVARLASGRLCYSPTSRAPDVKPRVDGPVRFCSFNRITKINDEVLACWSEILGGVAESVLRLKARAFDSVDDRAHFLRRCERNGIAPSRLELLGYGTRDETFVAYADGDIALDPFPFSGCATSFDALWMGLPVITMIGETMVSRQTASILTSLQLEECIASDRADCVRRAIALGSDDSRRRALRLGLRDRMRLNVCDVEQHASELTTALREAWRISCHSAVHSASIV
ncbi:MAG: tetratricopeptide repeat protein [Rudaea sp.]